MTGHSCEMTILSIQKNRMFGTFPVKNTPFFFKVTDQVTTFQSLYLNLYLLLDDFTGYPCISKFTLAFQNKLNRFS